MAEPATPSKTPQQADLMVVGASEIVTASGTQALGGKALDRVHILRDAALVVAGERIVAIGPEREIQSQWQATRTLDAGGGVVIPGLVDAHTHPVFLGTREGEFEDRLRGKTYLEIAQAGGGILSSLRGVRESSQAELVQALLIRMDRFLALGTTTVEAKSGYGLSVADEIKSLEAIREANARHPVDLVPTFLGAHDFPPEFRSDHAGYVELLCREMLPEVARLGLAEYFDVFTEGHVFGIEDSRRLLERARELGFGLRLHADQLTALGGAQLAAEMHAASADHLEHVTPSGMQALGQAGVVPVLCPLVPIFLRQDQEAPGRRMADAGLPIALATDFNPGSCYAMSLFEVLSFGALRYGLMAGEALTAATLNAACSLGRGSSVGTLEVGKLADLVLTDLPNHHHLTYELARSPVQSVIKRGKLVYRAAHVAREGLA
ncbi:MAG: imidazolonepropionase [Planctomycetes bacterium]|nr:imidazolonepropionase [Planctomycetota bacterium]MCB9908832.1 imidazolonepropionase [Planctomycetota bacterium]